jgi:hypothetical protein
MADAKTTGALNEQDDTEELIPVETPPKSGDVEEDDDTNADEGEEEEDGDERLGESEEDETDDEKASRNRRRRKRRAEMARKAKEHKERELAELRAIVAQQQQRLAAVEGFATSNVAQSLEQRIAQTRAEIRTAENIYVKAGEAGNYADQLAADKIRQQAQRELDQLEAAKADFSRRQQPQQQTQQPPQVDPQVVSYAKQWLEANPWYDPNGGDEDSAITRQIDAELVAEGFNPKTRKYWEELTARVAEAVGDDEPAQPKRRAPPKGNSRGDGTVSSKKQIYVTPERKAAMIEAGVWDDPVKRQKVLKAYQEHDRASAR